MPKPLLGRYTVQVIDDDFRFSRLDGKPLSVHDRRFLNGWLEKAMDDHYRSHPDPYRGIRAALSAGPCRNGDHILTHPRDHNNFAANELWHQAAEPELVEELLRDHDRLDKLQRLLAKAGADVNLRQVLDELPEP